MSDAWVQHIPVGREFGPCRVKIGSSQLACMLIPFGDGPEEEGVLILTFGAQGVGVELTSRKMADADISITTGTLSYEEFASKLICADDGPPPGGTLGYV